MQTTLVIIKPSGIQRAISGEVISRFEKKGLIIAGMKMMELSEKILREHYAHLVERPLSVWKQQTRDAGYLCLPKVTKNNVV